MFNILEEFIKEAESNQWSPSWPLPTDVYKSDWPWVPVKFNADFKKMHEECLANDHLFVGHRQKDRHLSYNHEGWAAITLHGINSTATENYEQYGFANADEANYSWTEVCELFPTCVEFIKSLQYSKWDRVRIMKLEPGGYIMPHVDGPGRVFGPLNIAINNPSGCDFYFRKWGKVPFEQGTGNFLDIGNEHIVWNQSNEARYHFIVHGHATEHIHNYTLNQMKERFEQTRVAYGVYNQVDRIHSRDLYLKAKGATLFYLERLGSKMHIDNWDPIRIICDDEIHNILQQALDEGFTHCLVVAAGCQIRNLKFHRDLQEFIKANEFGVAGHPLWKTDGRWLELHHQFFIVNLKAWDAVGRPEYGTWERDERMLPVLERSEENFHDDYTPLWVKATGKHAMQPGPCQGWQLMAAMFDGGYDVITLTENIRLSKFYTYPEFETEKFEESVNTLTPYEGQNWNQNKWINDSLFVKDQIWLFNSESLHIFNDNGPYDLVVNTASGFKLFDLFKYPRLTDNAKVIVYDFNPKSLAWYEHFYKWQGDDLLECIRAFPDRDHFTWVGQHDKTYTENSGFNSALLENYDYFGGKETFNNYWNEFKKLPVEFHCVDLYRKPQELAALMSGPGKKWLNLTNIFSTDATQMIFGHAECMAAQYRLLGYLYVVDPTIDVTIFDFWNRHKVGAVRDLL